MRPHDNKVQWINLKARNAVGQDAVDAGGVGKRDFWRALLQFLACGIKDVDEQWRVCGGLVYRPIEIARSPARVAT